MSSSNIEGVLESKHIINKIPIAIKNYFNIIKFNNKSTLLNKQKNDDTKINQLQAILKYNLFKKPLRNIKYQKSRNLSCDCSKDKTLFDSSTTNLIVTKIDSSVTQMTKKVIILPINIRNKVTESIIKRTISGHEKKQNIRGGINKSSSHCFGKPIKEKEVEEKKKIITSNVKNLTKKNKIIQSCQEISININMKQRVLIPEFRKRNKRDSSFLYCNSYKIKDNPQRNGNPAYVSSQIKFFIENMDQYSNDLLAMRQTLNYCNNQYHSTTRIFNNSSEKGIENININSNNYSEKYPIYFLPNLGQGLLEEIGK